jgi:hypothetical protein
MIKTLRITTIVAAIAAVVLLILPVVYGVRTDPKVEETLKAQTAVEKFSAARGQNPQRDESKTSPLVKQATDFGTYLNPPPPPQVEAAPSPTEIVESRPVVVTPKFDLVGVSYYRLRPEQSYALINEPGKGFTWVKQGSNVEHLVISEVKEDSIIIKDGQKSSEMKVPVQESWRNLLKKPTSDAQPAATATAIAQPVQPSISQPGVVQPGTNPASRYPTRARRGATARPGTDSQPAAQPAPATNPASPAPQINPRTNTIAPTPPQTNLRGAIQNPATQAKKEAPVQPAQTELQPPSPTPEPESTDNTAMGPPPLPTEKDIIHARLMEEVRTSKITEQEAKQLEAAATTLEQLEQMEAQRPQKGADANKPK